MTLNQTIFNCITYLSILSVGLPLLSGIKRYKAFNNRLLALFIYIIIAAGTEGLNFVLVAKNIYNHFVYNIFTMIECSLLTYFYLPIFAGIKAKRLILSGFIFFVIVAFYRFFYLGNLNNPDFIVSTFESSFFIILAYSFFYKLLLELNVINIYDYDSFWINSGFLFYFSTSFFLFLFNNFLEKMDLPHYYFFYSFHLIMNIVANVMLATGLWKVKAK